MVGGTRNVSGEEALETMATPAPAGRADSRLIAGPRGILQALTIVNLPSLAASAVLFSLTRGPYAATVRVLQSQLSGE